MRYKAIIVEDEQLARERLRKLLLNTNDIEVIGEATDGQEGIALIEKFKPDVIFLDVQMPLMDGFEMLQKLSSQPYVIFTTAYDQYAIKAFEENSIDYLLKPIEEERLQRSIKKLKEFRYNQNPEIQRLLMKLEARPFDTITVSLGDRIILVKTRDVAFFHAEDKYVLAHDKQGKKHLLSTALKDLETRLDSSFLRVHRSYIINCDYVAEIRKSFNGKLTFRLNDDTNTEITGSHGYIPLIKNKFQL